MATRELQAILNSGELTNAYLNGTATGNKLLESSVITGLTDALDTRLDAIESSHSVILSAASVASSQEPVSVDTALQVEFGPLQSTTDIDISAAGAITFKTAGKYIISPFFQYGRSGASGTSYLLNRYLVNGSQVGASLASKIDNASTLVPWSSSIQFTAVANDVLTIEIIRDSAGNNSGGLFALTPTAGWNTAPCAAIQIYKAV
jgi:hypothetical protein